MRRGVPPSATKRKEVLGFVVSRQTLQVHWRGRTLTYSHHPNLPPYLPLHYDLANIHDGKMAHDGPLGRKLKEFLGPQYRKAVRDPDTWIRDRLPPGINAWTLRRRGETDAELFRRLFLPGGKAPW